MAWQDEFRNSIMSTEQLCDHRKLSGTERENMERVISQFPMRIPQYYLSLADPDNLQDPIARLCIPSEDELSPGGSFDTSGEYSNTRQGGIQHKYRQTALILSTHVCAMYCRHCFRKRLVGVSEEELNRQAEEAAAYVLDHPEITNVLISGGDALMNPNDVIRRYLYLLCRIPGLDLIRFGSRVPVTFPQRISEDPELLNILACYARMKRISVVTQFNHPREITAESIRAVQDLHDRGIQVRNQTVLLRGVNDDPVVLGDLLRGLTRIGVVPYYIFQCRPVTGVQGRFQVPFMRGVEIVDGAKSLQNGFGKSVRFVLSHPRGKIEILGKTEENRMLFKYHQNKYPEDDARIFTVKVTTESTWLDDDLQAN